MLVEENAEVLMSLRESGGDLESPRVIDFSHVFPDRACAQAFAEDAEGIGFMTAVKAIERDANPWDVTASAVMVPTCENITATEEQLDLMARTHRGRSDGWGFLDIG